MTSTEKEEKWTKDTVTVLRSHEMWAAGGVCGVWHEEMGQPSVGERVGER